MASISPKISRSLSFFFFSSRRRHTRLTCDWSSDVYSSDLGQLGRALQETFAGDLVVALTHADWDVTLPPPPDLRPALVLHAAAWTDVDGAEEDPQGAAAVNVGGT